MSSSWDDHTALKSVIISDNPRYASTFHDCTFMWFLLFSIIIFANSPCLLAHLPSADNCYYKQENNRFSLSCLVFCWKKTSDNAVGLDSRPIHEINSSFKNTRVSQKVSCNLKTIISSVIIAIKYHFKHDDLLSFVTVLKIIVFSLKRCADFLYHYAFEKCAIYSFIEL